tara:strand:- start:37 stop:297 length:261 start_codon:yes stop_codon:yes gene_type:complete
MILTMYELNKEIADCIDQIDGAEVTNKGQHTGTTHCDIDFTYKDKFFHIDLKEEAVQGQSFFENLTAQMREIDERKKHEKEEEELN